MEVPNLNHLEKIFNNHFFGKPFILPTYDSQMRYDLEDWLKMNEIQIDIIAETQDTALKKLMASSDMAMIPAASHTVSKQVKDGELIEIGQLKTVFEELYLISSHRKISNPVASELMKKFTI